MAELEGILLSRWKFWSKDSTNHHELARKEYNSKKYDKAEPHLRALLSKDPNNDWANDVLSRLYMNTSRHAKAVPLLRKLGETGPDQTIFLHRLVRCLNCVNKESESINILEKLIDSGEITDEGWELLERALRKNANDPEYADNFWKTLSMGTAVSPQIDIQMIRIDIHEGNLNDAAKRIDRITSAGGEVDLSPKLRLKLAEILIQEGTPNTALEIVQSVDQSIPERSRIMANAKRALGDTTGAMESVSEGFEYGPTHGLLFSALRLAWDLGSMEGVVEHANNIIADKPQQRTALWFRLRALVKIGDIPRIREAIADTLEHVPDFVQAHRVMVDLAFSELEDWELTIHHCEEIMKVLPNDRRSLCNMSLSQLNLGNNQEALVTINHATIEHPDDDEVDLAAAQILWSFKDSGHLERINRMLSRHDLAPVESSNPEKSIAIENLSCNHPISSPTNYLDTPLVSIIMTVYGRDEYLDIAINSILSQTYQNIELLIVDDCSPDDAYEYLQTLSEKEPRVRVMQAAQNGGTYLAKNSAIRHAKGEYVGFMDSDDWTHPQRIELQLKALTSEPNARAICHSYFRVDEFGNISYKGHGAIRKACISLVAERSIFDIIGHFDSLRVGADTEFIERIQANWGDEAVMHDKIPTMFMLNHTSSLTGGGKFHISWRSITGPRLEHHSSFRAWHKKIQHGGADPYVDFPLRVRPYEVPQEMEAGVLHWKEGDPLFSELIQSRDKRWWGNKKKPWQRELSDKKAGQKWAKELGVITPEIIWSGSNLDEIPTLENLPDKVVIKPSKGFSAHNVLCLDNGINILDGSKWEDSQIKESFNSDDFLQRVKPVWMVEEFLRPEVWREDEKIPRDWKFYCFGDEIVLIHAVLRNSTTDKEKNVHHYFTPDLRQIRSRICQSRPVPKEPLFFPDCWNEMVRQIKRLGKELDCFMRIDMYATIDGPVFGEFTPTPEGGLGFTEWADRYLATFWNGLEGVDD